MAAGVQELLPAQGPWSGPRWQSRLAGAAGGLLAGLWVPLIVLFVDLLLHDGILRHDGPDLPLSLDRQAVADRVAALTGAKVDAFGFTIRDSGALPTLVAVRDPRLQAVGDWLYRNVPAVRTNSGYLAVMLILAAALAGARALLAHYQIRRAALATTLQIRELQHRLFVHKFSVGSQAFQRDLGARLASLLGEDIPKLHRALLGTLETGAREPAAVAVLLALAITLNPWLGLAFVLLGALAWVLGSDILRRVARRKQALAGDGDQQLQRLRGLADRLRLIKGYAADRYFQEQYQARLGNWQDDTLRRLTYDAALQPAARFLVTLLLLAVVGLGAQNVLQDKFGLAAALGVFAALVGVVSAGTRWFLARQRLGAAQPSVERIAAFLEQPAEGIQTDGSQFLSPMKDALVFEKVSHRGGDGKSLLDNLDLRLKAGERVAILATDPAEARALLDMLNRFLDPAQGSVRVDGQDLRLVTLESLRSQICLVLQGEMLFPDTVANNIGCGDPGFNREAIVEAAKVAHAHNFIQRLPHGYECLVGAEGFPLKAGEAFRIALARAILRDPPLVVIEEPAGPWEPDAEGLLDDTLTRFLRKRTSILLPQRLSTLHRCDRIVVLDKGRVAASGTHQALMESSATYRYLEYTRFHAPQPGTA